jgi:hypothetical protein
MQIDKLYFCHFLASEHIIFIIFGPTPNNSPLIIWEGIRIFKIKCHEAKKWQKQSLAICIFAVTPFMRSVREIVLQILSLDLLSLASKNLFNSNASSFKGIFNNSS